MLLESHCSGNVDPQGHENLITRDDEEQKTQVHSLLRLMKISNEFATLKDSMEMFPLPGNNVEPQLADSLKFGQQAGDFAQGMRATDLLMSLSVSEDMTKRKIQELAENAMTEVTSLFTAGEPLWQHDLDRGTEVLNQAEYDKRSNPNLDSTLDEIIKIIAVDAPLDLPVIDGAATEDLKIPTEGGSVKQEEGISQPRPAAVIRQGTREIGYIQMPAVSVIEILMDVRLWSFVFSEMLSRAAVLGILAPGAPGTQNEALLVMTAEYHAPSPLISTWQSCFARYCKEFLNNMWVIVDVSLESMIDNPLMNCKRKPSGYLIQCLPDGNTQITWIEHIEVEIAQVHPLFKSFVTSGIPFTAKQWADTLARKCQHLNLVIQHSLGGIQKENSPFNVEGLLRLAERMRRDFYGAVSATMKNKYKPLPIEGGNDILIKTLNIDNVQNLTVINVVTSSWLPFSCKKIFSFLGNVRNRIKWDILALGHKSEEVFQFHSGQGSEDNVSIVKMVDKKGNIDTIFLQEKQENAIASHIIFSPITSDSLVSLSNQAKIDMIPILSSGFAIISDENPTQLEESTGSIVTLSFQLLDRSAKAEQVPKKTIRKLYNLVTDTITRIRVALFEPPTDRNNNEPEGCTHVQRDNKLKQTDEADSINGIS